MTQIRATLKEEDYSFRERLNDDSVVFQNDEGGLEVWIENDDFAGFVLV